MFTPSKKTLALLADIENRIDVETEKDFNKQWHDFLYNEFDGEIFKPERKKLSAPNEEIPQININDAIEDYDLMLQSQLGMVSSALNKTGDNLCMRANYGTGILSSTFGAEIFVMPRETNTWPTTKAVNDTEWIREKVESVIPDINGGFGERVFEFGKICKELFAKYPKISEFVKMFHPDLQGPLDICEMLWGGEMFYAMYDEPELVHGMLSLATETYTKFLNEWHKLFERNSDMNPHWSNMCHRGNIFIRNDSAMNLSPDMYKEFSVPYDSLLLERFDGGAIHFCGRGDHYIGEMSKIPNLYAINLSQPHYNDMEIIYKNTVDKGIKILALNAETAERDKNREGGFRHNLGI